MTARRLRRAVRRALPRPIVRLLWNAASDLKDLPGRLKSGRPAPWRVVHNVGGGDFHRTGQALFETIRAETGLQPHETVLDMGCGAGRLAVPLCAYLSAEGRYVGFDIAPRALDFARRHVTGAAAIEFVHADLANPEYRREGGPAPGYRFPTGDGSVDLAVATSLFTHLDAETARAYLAETGRVLRPGGRAYVTVYEVHAADRAPLDEGRARLSLAPVGGPAFSTDPAVPEAAMGFAAGALSDWIEAAGLVRERLVVRGDWRDAAPSGQLQDHLILRKPG